MSNDFLDDIAEESLSDALTSGNLKSKPRDELERFFSDGYTACISIVLCTSCGVISRSLSGILHHETGSRGSSRAQHIVGNGSPNFLPQFSPNAKKTVTYLGSKVKVCAGCVESHGFIFDDEAEKRSIAT